MDSAQSNDLTQLSASVQQRLADPNSDVPTIRDVSDALAAATKEPEGVAYAEVDAGGVPALWCIPEGCGNDCVPLCFHTGGTVVFSINTDRKVAGHIGRRTVNRTVASNG